MEPTVTDLSGSEFMLPEQLGVEFSMARQDLQAMIAAGEPNEAALAAQTNRYLESAKFYLFELNIEETGTIFACSRIVNIEAGLLLGGPVEPLETTMTRVEQLCRDEFGDYQQLDAKQWAPRVFSLCLLDTVFGTKQS